MNALMVLAQAAAEPKGGFEQMLDQMFDWTWQQITSLTWFQAVLAISFGVVYMLYGWRIFRVLVVISFGMIGMFMGIVAGNKLGAANPGGPSAYVAWGGLIGTALMALLSIPLMKWCVSVLGAMAGGIITGGIWYALKLPADYIWAGTIIGLIAGGMISFILLKISVMLFTSLGGSMIMVGGVLSLLNQYELHRNKVVAPEETTRLVSELFFSRPWFLPAALIIPTLIGIIIQNRFIRHSPKWDIK